MDKHQHIFHTCVHDVKYCQPCRVVYCLNCDVTFYETLVTFTGAGTGTTAPYPWDNVTVFDDSFGGSDYTAAHADHERGDGYAVSG